MGIGAATQGGSGSTSAGGTVATATPGASSSAGSGTFKPGVNKMELSLWSLVPAMILSMAMIALSTHMKIDRQRPCSLYFSSLLTTETWTSPPKPAFQTMICQPSLLIFTRAPYMLQNLLPIKRALPYLILPSSLCTR